VPPRPGLDSEPRVISKVCFVVCNERHVQRNGVGRNEFVECIPLTRSVGRADGSVCACGFGIEGRDDDVVKEALERSSIRWFSVSRGRNALLEFGERDRRNDDITREIFG
jgi:hypothetical protein